MGSHDRPSLPEIEGYTVEREIGRGGFSRVYRATQHGLERPVAIKVLNASFEDERQQRTFERECRVMGQLSAHQNIVTVFASAMTADGHPCIIMELYQGTYRSDERLPVPEVVDVGAKIAGALHTIHDGGIVHRDIKPHNIFVSEHGEPAIGDFGISSIESERTVTGGAGFSINYAPPEVFEDAIVGPPGDVYSLGATLYQLASGEVPFPHTGDPAEKTRATVHKIIATPPPELRRSDAPPELGRLLRRCMAKAQTDRPASAADVASSLFSLQTKVGRPSAATTLERFRDIDSPTPPSPLDSQPPQQSTGPEQTGSVTIVRDQRQAKPADDAAEPAKSESRPGSPPKGLLIGLAACVVIVAISALAIVLFRDGESDVDSATQTPNTLPPTTAAPFQVLRAPTDLAVTRSADGSYELTWTSTQNDVKYQVLLIGSGENRVADTTSFTWTADDAPSDDSACFEVRTTDSEVTRVSQAAAGPVCSALDGSAPTGSETAANVLLAKPEVTAPLVLPEDLVVSTLINGEGPLSRAGDTVELYYVGVRSVDGTEFDSNYESNLPLPVTLGLNSVIEGLEQGLLGVQAGGRYQLDIPADLAFGDSAIGAIIRPGDALTFVVDVVSITQG